MSKLLRRLDEVRILEADGKGPQTAEEPERIEQPESQEESTASSSRLRRGLLFAILVSAALAVAQKKGIFRRPVENAKVPPSSSSDQHRVEAKSLPDADVAENARAIRLFDEKRYAKALVALQGLLKRYPASASLLANICACEWRLGFPADAVKSCKAALKLEPNSAGALNQLALALGQSGKGGVSTALLEKASRIRPNAEEIWFNLAWSYEKDGEFSRAAEAYQSFISLVAPDSLASRLVTRRLQSLALLKPSKDGKDGS